MKKKNITLQNKNIHYTVSGVPGSLCVLMIHGAGCSSDIFKYQLKGLGNEISAAALDLPGHGESHYNGELSMADYRDAVLDVIGELNCETMVLAAHSMGCGVAMEVYAHNPGLIDAMVFISGGARLPVNPDILNFMENEFESFCSTAAGFSCSPDAASEVKELIEAGLRDVGGEVVLRDFTLCNTFDYREAAAACDIPLLLLTNEKDRMVPLKLVKELHELVPGSKLIVYPEMGHYPHCENHGAVNRDITEFVRTL